MFSHPAIFAFMVIVFITAFFVETLLENKKAHRRGETTISDATKQSANAYQTMLDDQVKKQRMKHDYDRICARYKKESMRTNIPPQQVVFNVIQELVGFPYDVFYNSREEWEYAIPFEPCDHQNIKNYMVSRYPDRRQYLAIAYLVYRTNESILQFFGSQFAKDRTWAERSDLFWMIHRLESYYVPRVRKFYTEVAKHRKHPCRTYFPNIIRMYFETKDRMWYDYNRMTGGFGPDRFTGFALEKIASDKNRRWMYFLDMMVRRISFMDHISYRDAFSKLESYF